VEYTLTNGIAILSLDDGKANAVGHSFSDFVNASLDQAEKDNATAVVIHGKKGMFSAGFDLKEFQTAQDGGMSMVAKGFELLIRLYSFPLPVVAACTGHAVAMGAFLLCGSDTRIGARGDFRITLPETAIGMDIPIVLQAITEARISPRYATRAMIQAEVFDPEMAVEVGFLDRIVDEDKVIETAMTCAEALSQLPQKNYAGNKLFVREPTLKRMRDSLADLRGQIEKATN